jgi:hypothetical protein
MAQEPQWIVDPGLSQRFPAEALKSLESWCRGKGTSIELESFLGGGKTEAEVAVVRTWDGRPAKRVLKYCPSPEGDVSLDAQRYRNAQAANENFTREHLARMVEFIPDRDDGVFLLMEWRGGGDENYQPLASFLDLETLGSACREIVSSVLIDWQENWGMPQGRSVGAHEILRCIAGGKCQPNRSLDRVCRGLGLADADRISRGGTEFGNVFRAVSQGTGFTDFRTAGIRGNGHGDLHPGNILVPTAQSVRPLERCRRYFLIDLSSFDSSRFLAIDPAHLVLSLANERLGKLEAPQRDQLRELILDPANADAGGVPAGIAEATRAISQVGRDHHSDGRGLSDDWRDETLLAIAGCALLFVGRNSDTDIRWWFLQLGGMAIDRMHDRGRQPAERLPRGPAVTRSASPASQLQTADGPVPVREQASELGFISADARQLDELRSASPRLCAELAEAAEGLDPYLARGRGTLGTSMARAVLGDITDLVAALRSWLDRSPHRQSLSATSALALVQARLNKAAGLVREINDSGCTPTRKSDLSEATTDLNDAFESFFSKIILDPGGGG